MIFQMPSNKNEQINQAEKSFFKYDKNYHYLYSIGYSSIICCILLYTEQY